MKNIIPDLITKYRQRSRSGGRLPLTDLEIQRRSILKWLLIIVSLAFIAVLILLIPMSQVSIEVMLNNPINRLLIAVFIAGLAIGWAIGSLLRR